MATSRSSPAASRLCAKTRPAEWGAELPFRRVLIANRGEIAVRIIRACRELGIEAIAVYSDADAEALHTAAGDVAVRIGPPRPPRATCGSTRSSRRRWRPALMRSTPVTGSSPSGPAFARAVEAAGLVFVGPSPDAIEALGESCMPAAARALGRRPGRPGHARAGRRRAAGPVAAIVARPSDRVPAAGQGSGRRRRSRDAPGHHTGRAARGARRRLGGGPVAFGDGAVYLEREILPARHIEVQLLGDVTGRVVALGERDCSIQRRHQKLVEEAPAPGLSRDGRRDLHAMAVRLGEAAGLRNAATAEFLLGPDGGFAFLEVNTRLQVEHGVTELVTGLDLVREQLRLAAGLALSEAALAAAEKAADPDGHAIEVRIAAENPAVNFTPTPGRITLWTMPAGPGVRVDSGVGQGDRVAPEYDNLIAKLMVHAADRDAAIDRLRRALDETEIGGVQTTLPFHRFVARDESFRDGVVSTGWVGEHYDGPAGLRSALRVAKLAAGLEAVAGPGDQPLRERGRPPSGTAAGARPDEPTPSTGGRRDGGRGPRLVSRVRPRRWRRPARGGAGLVRGSARVDGSRRGGPRPRRHPDACDS